MNALLRLVTALLWPSTLRAEPLPAPVLTAEDALIWAQLMAAPPPPVTPEPCAIVLRSIAGDFNFLATVCSCGQCLFLRGDGPAQQAWRHFSIGINGAAAVPS